MAWLRKFAFPVLRFVAFWSVAHGIILWLAWEGIHPDEWVARLIDSAASSELLAAVSLMLSGLAAIVCSVAWELLNAGVRLRRIFGPRDDNVEKIEATASGGSQPATPLAGRGHIGTAANFENWDHVEHLAVWQAACLWAGIEPDLNLAAATASPSYVFYSMLLRDIEYERIVPSSKPGDIFHWQLSRKDLRKLARRKPEKPAFLFPETRSKARAFGPSMGLVTPSSNDLWTRILSAIRKKPRSYIAIVGVGVAIVSIVGAILISAYLTRTSQVAVPSRLDGQVKRGIWGECNATYMPVVVPPEGRIYVLQLNAIPAESGGGGLGQVFGTPGSEWSWSEAPGHSREAYGCEITNYSDGPAFNVALAIGLVFRDVVVDPKLPNQKTSGAITLSREWPIEIPKIEPGAEARFRFYIFNMSAKFAEATLGSSATVQRLGENTTETVSIMQPSTNHMWFVPLD